MESQCNDEEDPVKQRDLPFDLVIQNILSRLPIKSIVRFKTVSKLWYSTLSSSRFAFTHLKFPNHSTTESLLIQNGKKFKIMSSENGEIDLVNIKVDFDVGDEDMDLVGTCNGLVCLGSTSGRLCIVWNPITREFRYVSNKISNTFGPKCMVYWGFGYVSTGDDYKIVRLCMSMSSRYFTIHAYSIKLDTWRVISDDAFDDTSNSMYPLFVRMSGLFVNETLYWRLPGTICSFNLATEKLDIIRHLEVIAGTPLSYVTSDNMLFAVNRCLSSYGTCLSGGDRIFTILKSSEVTEQIIVPTEVTKSMHYAGNLIGFSRSDKIFTHYSDCLGVIDLSLHPLSITPFMNLERKGITKIVSYCASLISPKFGCYKYVQG